MQNGGGCFDVWDAVPLGKYFIDEANPHEGELLGH